jgi:MFS family permease
LAEEEMNEAPAGKSAWVLIAILVLFYIIAVLDRHVIAMLVDPIRAGFGLSDLKISYLMGTAFALFYAVGGLPMGWLIDRFPRRRVLYAGIALWGLAQASCGLATSFEQLFLARVMTGFAEATLMPAAHSMISDAFPRNRLATPISVFSMGAGLGAGVSTILGGWLVQTFSSHGSFVLPLLGAVEPWQAVFFATGLPALVIGLLIFTVREPPRRRKTSVAQPLSGIFTHVRHNWRVWLCLASVFATMNIAYGSLVYWQPAYYTRFFHWTPAQYGLAIGITTGIAGPAGMLFSGKMVDRMMARGIADAPLVYYRRVLLLTTPIVLFALLSSNVWVYVGLIWIAQFATVNFLGFSSAAVQLIAPPHIRGRAAALFTTMIVALVGAALGSLVPAFIAEHVLGDNVRLGYSIALTFAICVPIALAGIAFGRRSFREAIEAAEARDGPGGTSGISERNAASA